MSKEKMTKWLTDWKRNLLEVFVIAGVLASGFTTLTGAYQLVNRNLFVALLFSLFIQGGLFIVSHYTSVNGDDRKHRRTFTLWIVWLILAFFSVYTSSLGMFEIQRSALRDDRARSGIFNQWNEAAKSISDFKTRSLAEINQTRQATTLELNVERGRARAARLQRRPYSTENIQRLNAELAALANAEKRVREIRLLSIATPENSEDARRALDETFGSVNEAYAALPEQLRARIIVPQPSEPTEISEHIQKQFWDELLNSSIPVILIVIFSLLIDLLPPLVLFATSPKQTLPERVLSLRLWAEEIRYVARTQLKREVELVHVSVINVPELIIQMTVPARHGGPLLFTDRDFAGITEEVRRERGSDLLLESAETASGKRLENGLPFLKQLGDEREVVLSYAPSLDISSTEVN